MNKLLLAIALCLAMTPVAAQDANYPPYIVVPPPTPYDPPFVVTRPIYGYSYWRAPWTPYSYGKPFIPYYRPPVVYPPRFGYRWRWR